MQSLLSPATPGDVGPHVAALQDALMLLLVSGVLGPLDPASPEQREQLRELAGQLAAECAKSEYGKATTALVLLIQGRSKLGDDRRGVADVETVSVISTMVKELRKDGCGCGGNAVEPMPRRTEERSDEGILSPEDAEALDAAMAAAAGAGVSRESIDLIMGAMSDLGALDQLGVNALSGATWFEDVAASVEDWVPWGRDLSIAPRWMPTALPALRLRSSGALPVAAYLAGALDRSNRQNNARAPEAGMRLSRKAMTAFLWRAEPIARVVFAARAWSERRLAIEDFAAVLSGMSNILRKPLDPKDLISALRESLTILPFPSPIGPIDPLWPKRPPFSAWLLPENQAWAHCVFGLQRLFPPLPNIPEKAPPPGIIEPGTICLGSIPSTGLEVKLVSPAGGDFGLQEPTPSTGEMWGLAVNGAAAEILSWTATEIRFNTMTLQAGCNKVSWTWSSSWSPDGNGVGAACSEALRIPPIRFQFGVEAWIVNQTRLWTSPGQDLVAVGPSVGAFTASTGSGATPAEACTPVTIGWQVAGLGCQSAAALATIRLVRERIVLGVQETVVLFANADPQGTITETLDATASYRLELTSRDAAGNSCGASEAVLIVARQKIVRLVLPARVIAGQQVTGRVSISCPAPIGGLPISFVVTPSAALDVPSVLIPEGATSSAITLTARLCGLVSVTATTPDHTAATASTCGLIAPTITSIVPPMTMQACTPFTVAVMASCITQSPELTAFAVANGRRIRLSVSAPAGGTCGRSTTLTLSVPALAAGTYSIELEDAGGSATSPQTLTVAPNPQIVSRAFSHDVFLFGSACPRPASSISVDVRGADTVVFAYAHPDGTVTRTVTDAAADCETWRATFSAVFDRVAPITVTPSSGGTSGPSIIIPVVLTFGTGMASALDFFASDPAGTSVARPLQVVRSESNPTTGATSTIFEASIANLATRRVTLKPCVQTNFPWSRPQVDDANSTSTPKARIPGIFGNSGPWHGHPDAPVARDQG